MHLTGRHKINALGAGILMLAGLSYVGSKSLKPDAPMSVAPLSGAVPPVETPRPKSGTSTPTPVEEPEPEQVVVAMAGSVKVPGLLHLPTDARVDDAIKAAGGAKADADLETINLAAKLVDGDQVFVPAKKKDEPARAAEAEKVAPRYRGGEVSPHYAPLAVPMPPTLGGSLSTGKISIEAAHGRGAPKAKATGPVSLNTGSEAQLETLPGVGPSTAQKILDYRQEHGGFSSVEEITAVKGIGPKKFEKMKPFLKL